MLLALGHASVVRFAVVGTAMTALHLTVFRLALPVALPEIANVVAFLVATQVNFALSYVWTWSSRRRPGRETLGVVLRRAVLFTGAALLGFGVNAAAFTWVYRIAGLPPVASALAATVLSAATNFVLGSRVVFADRSATGATTPQAFPPEAAFRGATPRADGVVAR